MFSLNQSEVPAAKSHVEIAMSGLASLEALILLVTNPAAAKERLDAMKDVAATIAKQLDELPAVQNEIAAQRSNITASMTAIANEMAALKSKAQQLEQVALSNDDQRTINEADKQAIAIARKELADRSASIDGREAAVADIEKRMADRATALDARESAIKETEKDISRRMRLIQQAVA